MTRIAIDNHWQCHGSSLLALFCDKGNAVKRHRRGLAQDSVMTCTIERRYRATPCQSICLILAQSGGSHAVAQKVASRGGL
ncbi:hypothetical protein FMJ37_20765 [Klebsiella michiganensis]|nr:hypothetical protein [Klebsiella michiganensis]MBE0204089.1 hypothetical protein [Klebsiella michiganensis]MBZ7435255.1 hypothetical protein [Klebsiella michiganensis]MBZ7494999.1 hypothetical protein [Klebsiella michiganensis]